MLLGTNIAKTVENTVTDIKTVCQALLILSFEFKIYKNKML